MSENSKMDKRMVTDMKFIPMENNTKDNIKMVK